MTAAEQKRVLRKQMLALRAERADEERVRISNQITAFVLEQKELKAAQVVFLYKSVNDEISTYPLQKALLHMGKTVCFPKCYPKGIMSARRIYGDSDFTEVRYDIPEPGTHCTEVMPEEIDVVLAPCLCADRDGYRLGYGGGYYDRFLPCACHAVRFVLCASESIVSTVYAQSHDVACHKIVTDRGVLETRGK